MQRSTSGGVGFNVRTGDSGLVHRRKHSSNAVAGVPPIGRSGARPLAQCRYEISVKILKIGM